MAALCFIHPLNYILWTFMGIINGFLRNLHDYGNTSHLFFHNMTLFWPYDFVLLMISLFGYSIFSVAGVSHTVAALYTSHEPSFKDTMSLVAKVWKRVLVTFLCVLLVFLVYHIIAGFAFFLIVLPFGKVDEITFSVAFVFYFVGLLYLVVAFQLAGVVSVLEESCGFKALAKSRLLLKDKMASATAIVLTIYFGFGIFLWLEALVRKMLLSLSSMIMWMHVLGSLSLLLLILVFLLWSLVLETMFYFICKLYHLENIDMSAISDEDHVTLRSSEC
ncbi:uncharacterized protein LOC120076263 [Benincasa hispida]|uniref:uncharacterized protein LOC120076263 n=1 Tax=Benincasa hispida TaxID=102211 RepID=UPI001900071D|nr:uncharacterized protein LOC120076263 [Benincasa hispida]